MKILIDIVIIGSVTLLFSLLYKLSLDRKYQKREEEIKNYLDVIVSLSISHIHDASNFFSLIKQDLEAKELDKKELKNFSKGAAYHFRSLFDELKGTKEFFDLSDFDKLLKNKVHLFYKKETLDLKDLLELELFQVSNFKRLKFIDEVSKTNAMTLGNFSLLSKLILNLVENALKYTDEEVRIELRDMDPEASTSSYELRIISYGEGIPEDLATQIKNNKSSGHGLSSLVDIMDFHDAEYSIDTIKGTGTCVNLRFSKYYKNSLASSELSGIKALGFGESAFSGIGDQDSSWFKSSKFFVPLPIRLLAVSLGVVALFSISWVNKMLSDHYYEENMVRVIKSAKKIEGFKEKRQDFSLKLSKLEDLINLAETNEYTVHVEKLLDNFSDKNKSLVKLIIFKQIPNKNDIYIQDYLLKQAESLQKLYPNLLDINYLMADIYWQKAQYLKSVLYSANVAIALLSNNFMPDKEVYLVETMFKDRRIEKNLVARFLAAISKNDRSKGKAGEAKLNVLSKPTRRFKDKASGTSLEHILSKDSEKATMKSLDKMIEEQDRSLGIDLSL